MRLVLTGRHVDITPGLRRLVDRKLARLERILGNALVSAQVKLALDKTGHCFCADPFINYQTVRELGLLKPGDKYLMTSAGLGQTFSAAVFQH